MRSPFPGMDPYLEMHWRDVHHRLITYSCDVIQGRLPSDLVARVEERVYLEAELGESRARYPDVKVVEYPRGGPAVAVPESDVAVAEPLVLEVPPEAITEGYIAILDAASGNRVVTVIEYISPTNKLPGVGQDAYIEKQQEVLASRASLVEIDLTRAGRRQLSMPQWAVPRSHRTTYQMCVRRAWRRWQAEMYRAALADRLPIIRVPLRETDADVPLDLQSLVDQCYQNGRYDRIDYREPPDPPFDANEAPWVQALLESQGRR